MKKILFLVALTVFLLSASQAQLKQTVDKSRLKTTEQTIKTTPANPGAPPPPPPATQKSSPATTEEAPVYTLTSVRVKIKTGNDNKEFPSKVHARLMAKSTPANWRNYLQINLSNEMRINSETEFGLNVEGPPTPLTTFQAAGLVLTISYEPNFFADAWKIEGITLVLEFKDQKGNLHPTLGNKTIVFTNAYGFLNAEYRNIECVTDASFAPMTAVIKKY